MEDLKELKELLSFGFDLQRAITLSLAGDGKIDFRDLPFWFAPFGSAGAAFKNVGNPMRRFRSLSDGDRLELLNWAKNEFSLVNTNLELLIEDTLDIAAANIALVRRWRAFSAPAPAE